MSQTFYNLLSECIETMQERNRTAVLDPQVWQEFCTDNAVPRQAKPLPVMPSRTVQPPSAHMPPAGAPRPAPPQEMRRQEAAPPPQAVNGRSVSWEELAATVRDCRNCRLCEQRTNTVFGEGNPRAELMFIGEGPGADEDRTGRPFVGKAGQLLDKMIGAMKYAREEVYIANVVKCRPPDNRAPSPDEAMACIGYLKRQIELIQPKVIVCLGGVALSFLLNQSVGITRMRGNWLSFDGIPVMPTFHPAFLLRQESAKRDAWHDLQQVMRALGKLPRQ